jgi:hypothetical protein
MIVSPSELSPSDFPLDQSRHLEDQEVHKMHWNWSQTLFMHILTIGLYLKGVLSVIISVCNSMGAKDDVPQLMRH